MGENSKESKLSGERKPTNVNKTQKSRLVKDGAVVENENGGVTSSTAKGRSGSTSRSTNSAKKLAGSRPVPATKKSTLVQKSGSSTTTSVSSSSSSSTTEVSYAAYNGDAGVARFIWWALASLALIIALGLVATQCFGSSESENSATGSSSQLASTPASATESESEDVAADTPADPPVDEPAPAGPVSELEANSLAALAASELTNVDVSIDGDVATLTGAVATEADKVKAEETVAEVEGVGSIINNLDVDDSLEPTSAVSAESGTADEEATSTSVEEPSETPAAEPEPAEPSYNG